MIDRDSLIAAGWTPPADDPDYEAWRPALQVYADMTAAPQPANPLDAVDKKIIDVLRAVVLAAPKSDEK